MLAVHFPLRFLSAADFASFGCGPPQDFLYGARFKGEHLAKQVELDSCEIRFLCWVIFMLFFRVTSKPTLWQLNSLLWIITIFNRQNIKLNGQFAIAKCEINY